MADFRPFVSEAVETLYGDTVHIEESPDNENLADQNKLYLLVLNSVIGRTRTVTLSADAVEALAAAFIEIRTANPGAVRKYNCGHNHD